MSTLIEIRENASPVCLFAENPNGLVSLWEMLRSYFPIYQVALKLGEMLLTTELGKGSGHYQSRASQPTLDDFRALVERITQVCSDHELMQTSEFAKRILRRPLPKTDADLFTELNHLNDALSSELEKEAVFRMPPGRVGYFNCRELFGSEVATAFPSCARDIQKAGECYAFEQEDACVHHLMLVLERGLHVLATKLQVPYQTVNWQVIIDQVSAKLKSQVRGTERDFLLEVNAQFGFLKVAYRNHSEHAHEDVYDMPKALSILNHVREFMQALARGGLTE
jgi:hypothetical protein